MLWSLSYGAPALAKADQSPTSDGMSTVSTVDDSSPNESVEDDPSSTVSSNETSPSGSSANTVNSAGSVVGDAGKTVPVASKVPVSAIFEGEAEDAVLCPEALPVGSSSKSLNMIDVFQRANIALCAYANINDRKAAHDSGFDCADSKSHKIEKRADLVCDEHKKYTDIMWQLSEQGVTYVGGCCGCGPNGIAALQRRFFR
jgi:hypothetical protein